MSLSSSPAPLPKELHSIVFSSPTPEPTVALQIAFSDKHQVVSGQKLPLEAVQAFPSRIDYVAAGRSSDASGALHTLVLLDPDAPSAASPTSRSFLHLIQPNIRSLTPDELVHLAASASASSSSNATAALGENASRSSTVHLPEEGLMPWRAPGPGKGSGPHRYVWVLLSQPNGEVSFAKDHPLREGTNPAARRHFDVSKFAKKELGENSECVGAVWMVVEAEE